MLYETSGPRKWVRNAFLFGDVLAGCESKNIFSVLTFWKSCVNAPTLYDLKKIFCRKFSLRNPNIQKIKKMLKVTSWWHQDEAEMKRSLLFKSSDSPLTLGFNDLSQCWLHCNAINSSLRLTICFLKMLQMLSTISSLSFSIINFRSLLKTFHQLIKLQRTFLKSFVVIFFSCSAVVAMKRWKIYIVLFAFGHDGMMHTRKRVFRFCSSDAIKKMHKRNQPTCRHKKPSHTRILNPSRPM